MCVCSYNNTHSDLTSISMLYSFDCIVVFIALPSHRNHLEVITTPKANVKCAFTLCLLHMCVRMRLSERMPCLAYAYVSLGHYIVCFIILCIPLYVMSVKEKDIQCKPYALFVPHLHIHTKRKRRN